MNIAFFDFDGTITTKDTLIEFIKYSVGEKNYYFGMFANLPMLLRFKLKLLPNDEAKQRLLTYFFGNWSEDKFKTAAYNYSINEIDKVVKKSALEKIDWHKKNGDRVVVVSASLESWLKPWCEKNNLDLICTKMSFDEGEVSGRFLGKNCHGHEKADKIKESFDLKKFDKIYAYGDSSGDKQMLELSTNPHFRVFK
jgi:HAD superfamily hydrolase (TIGR01490 family)